MLLCQRCGPSTPHLPTSVVALLQKSNPTDYSFKKEPNFFDYFKSNQLLLTFVNEDTVAVAQSFTLNFIEVWML